MTFEETELRHFLRLMDALSPLMDRLVVVGGWAHQLYREHENATAPAHPPLFTDDADIALSRDTTLSPNEIVEQLTSHGFVPEFRGEERPPITHWKIRGESSNFYAEFLSPAPGRQRRQEPDTERIGGVVAQRLRYIEILLIPPWWVTLLRDNDERVAIRVANPVAYIAQKLLIQEDRVQREDRAKDFLYIHDTIEVFNGALDRLRTEWRENIHPSLPLATSNAVETLAAESFREVTDDVRRAALAAAPRALKADDVRALCELGLGKIF